MLQKLMNFFILITHFVTSGFQCICLQLCKCGKATCYICQEERRRAGGGQEEGRRRGEGEKEDSRRVGRGQEEGRRRGEGG